MGVLGLMFARKVFVCGVRVGVYVCLKRTFFVVACDVLCKFCVADVKY